MANLKRFIFNAKLIIYTQIFVKYYKWKNYRQIYKIYGIIKLKKMRVLIIIIDLRLFYYTIWSDLYFL